MLICFVSPWLPEPGWCLSDLLFWWLDWLSSMATAFLPVFVSSQLHSSIVEKQKVLNAETACMRPRGQGAVRSQAYSLYNWGLQELIHSPRLVHSMKSWGCPDVSHDLVIPMWLPLHYHTGTHVFSKWSPWSSRPYPNSSCLREAENGGGWEEQSRICYKRF